MNFQTPSDSNLTSSLVPKGLDSKLIAQPKDYQELEKLIMVKVEKVLADGFSEKRARMLDADDFIKMLLQFNKEGIHFA
jgi:hypothetical protein